MKKILSFVAVVITAVSCSPSLESKAELLIQKNVKNSLYVPDSYDPVSTTALDSAFTPLDAPEFYEKTLQLVKLGVEIDKCDREAAHEQSSMALWSGPYRSAYAKAEYNEAKAKYEKYMETKKKAEAKVMEIVEELRKLASQEPKFIGYKVTHRYRAQTNGGTTQFGQTLFLFDENVEKTLAMYNVESDEYKAVQLLYSQMMDASSYDVNLDTSNVN